MMHRARHFYTVAGVDVVIRQLVCPVDEWRKVEARLRGAWSVVVSADGSTVMACKMVRVKVEPRFGTISKTGTVAPSRGAAEPCRN